MLDGRYLIARIAGAGQDPGERKVLGEFFRYKDYIHNPKWLNDSSKGRWGSNYLGFKAGWENLAPEEITKIEFQNPPYSAAWRMSGDPKDFNKVFTVQVAGCDFDCNYCFVPKGLNIGDKKAGRFFSAKKILRIFLGLKSKSVQPMNVIRISGGNPTIVPEIVLNSQQEIAKRGNYIYLWIDSNLSTARYMKALGRDFKTMLKQKNVGVVGCFKGTSKADFAKITGAGPKNYEEQFKTAKWFIESGADFYAYLPALVYRGNIERKLAGFARKLIRIHPNLPLRTEILAIVDFPGAKQNYMRSAGLGRAVPTTDQRLIFDAWYNKVLPRLFRPEDLKKFSCQVPLN
jgi:uncharacterized Fe-S cluster-containing radical SAM superfamily protein